jgi:energy-converting hydrogenase Eha subunit B
MNEKTLHGALTFLGFAISIMAVFYFAGTYVFRPDISEWTRLAALILLGLCFAFLGVYLRDTTLGQPFFAGSRLAWLRPPVVMYLLALFAGIAAESVFLGMDGVDRAIKILASLLVGIGLIVAVAQRAKRPAPPTAPPAPPV